MISLKLILSPSGGICQEPEAFLAIANEYQLTWLQMTRDIERLVRIHKVETAAAEFIGWNCCQSTQQPLGWRNKEESRSEIRNDLFSKTLATSR